MALIRVGIIGLSTSAITSWAKVAHLPYLESPNGKYIIAAVCNSSVASARSAIKTYELPPTTKAYGDASDLANDPEIDFVVCSTRVDLHYPTIKPSLEKGKDVYVEWPLGANVQEAQELNALAKEKGARTVVGLQGRVSPIVLQIKSLIEEGVVGPVLSSSVDARGGTKERDTISEGLKYFMDRKVGGNMVTIGFAHMIDYICFALGDLTALTSRLHLQRPEVPLRGPDGKTTRTVTSDVPDLIHLFGLLPTGAPVIVNFQRGQPFPNDPGLVWRIHGSKGEIRVASPSGPTLQAFGYDKATIHVHDFETDEVKKVDWKEAAKKYAGLPEQARNIAVLYEAFAEGRGYPDFGDALARHEMLEEVWKGF